MLKENDQLEVKLNSEINRTADLRGTVYDALDEIESITTSYNDYKKTFKVKSFKEYLLDSGEDQKIEMAAMQLVSPGLISKPDAGLDRAPVADCFPVKKIGNQQENPVYISSATLSHSQLLRLYSSSKV